MESEINIVANREQSERNKLTAPCIISSALFLISDEGAFSQNKNLFPANPKTQVCTGLL